MKSCLIVTNLCHGYVRPYSPVCCERPYSVIDNIIELSRNYNYCFVINDSHRREDNEFHYVPPHCIMGTEDSICLSKIVEKIYSPYKTVLIKDKMSALWSKHNRDSISTHNFDKICVTGFSATLDIIPTTLDLMQFAKSIEIKEDCIGDLNESLRNNAISYLRFLGININV